MSITDKLLDNKAWDGFLEYKLSREFLRKEEKEALSDFITNRRYVGIAERIASGDYEFSPPVRSEVNKFGTSKKRVVYSFIDEEGYILKFIAYLLYAYEDKLPPNCYAFRRSVGAKKAFTDIRAAVGSKPLWCFKTDISNYFNSIDTDMLAEKLRAIMSDDPKFLSLLLSILQSDKAIFHGETITEKRGAMAGTPISAFLANLYLSDLDRYFLEKGVIYARYSDDIIIFDSEEHIHGHIEAVHGFFERYGLSFNPQKESLTAPYEEWSFLGFCVRDGQTDISRAATAKLMGSIRRQARSVRRWMLKKHASPEKGLTVFNRKFNRRFYPDSNDGTTLCWSRWYFPLITTDKTLRSIDSYMQQNQRYLVTGKHNKRSVADVPYELLKNCGYRPLVHEYYDRSS